MKALYTGHEALTFMDYLDLESGRTLVAEPGGTYDVTAVSAGRPVPELPPGFTAVKTPEPEKETRSAKAAEEPAPEVTE